MNAATRMPCYYPDPSLPIRVIRHGVTVEHDAYPLHVHADRTWECCYVVEGHVTAMLRGRPRRLGPGEAYIMGPDDAHGFDAWSGRHRTLMFQQEALEQLAGPAHVGRSRRLQVAGRPLPGHLRVAPPRRTAVETALDTLRSEALGDEPLKQTMASLLLAQLLLELSRSIGTEAVDDAPPVTAVDTIEQFTAELRASLDYPWTLGEMVRRAGYSTSQLSLFFRQVTALSPCEWLREERLRRARLLLAQTDMKIAQIAAEVGFGSLCHFGRVFREAVGMTPRQYRETTRPRH